MHVRQVRYHSPGTEGPRVMHAVFSPHSGTKTSVFRISYIYLFPASLPEPTGLLPRLLLFARGSTCLPWGDFGGGVGQASWAVVIVLARYGPWRLLLSCLGLHRESTCQFVH